MGGCPIGGKGYVQSEPLDASGTYTVAIDPDVPATGQATLRVFVTSDRNEGTVGVNGAPVTGTIDRPGQQVAWTFSGTSGQRLSVDVSAATLADECNVLAVMAPDRSTVSTGCIIGGKGSLGPATLPATGTYTLVLHASDGNTGRATLRVTSS